MSAKASLNQITKMEESGDYPDLIPSPADYANVPGWTSLETFIRTELGVDNKRAIEVFRKFHNHYLKNFPVHYFTGHSIPEIDFALFFPVRGGKANSVGSHIEPHYLVAVSEKNGRVVLFHKKLSTSLKTRQNFYRMTERWAQNNFPEKRFDGSDIGEILNICERPEELLALRKIWFSRFLEKLERKLNKMNQHRPFKDKWAQIREFLTERDRKFLYLITEKMKSEHVDFEAAHAAAGVSQRNLDIYNWIMEGQSEQAIRNRTRVTPYYPWLVKALSSKDVVSTYKFANGGAMGLVSGMYDGIEEIIDEGFPLIEALEIYLSNDDPLNPLRQSTIRKTMRLKLSRDLLNPHLLASLLRLIENHLPHVRLQEGMLERIHALQENSEAAFKYLGSSVMEVLASSREVQEQLLDKDRFITSAVSDTVDYMRQVYVKAVLPYFVWRSAQAGCLGLNKNIKAYLEGRIWDKSFIQTEREEERQPPYSRPFGHMMFHNIVKLSIYWHDKLRHFVPRMRSVGIDKNIHWPTMTGKVSVPKEIIADEVTIEPLGSSLALQKNHEEFGHCIDGYTANCLGLVEIPGIPRTYSHAFRIAAKGGSAEKGTLIVSEPYRHWGTQRSLSVVEIDTKRIKSETRNPPDKNSILWKAARWYVTEINASRLKVDWDAIDRARGVMDFKAIDAETGFDATIYNNCVEAFNAMRSYLPENQRHYSYEGWIAKMGFDKDADRLFRAGANLSLKDLNALDYQPA